MPRRVSILVPDLASNILGAATVLARHLQPDYDVEIVGPDLGGGINAMYRNAFAFKAIAAPRIYRYPEFWRDVRRLQQAVTGEIVLAVKAYANTLPVALALKRERGCRVVAYLDEWDGAVFSEQGPAARFAGRWRQALHPLDDAHFARVERRIREADLVLGTTRFLRDRFGAHILPFGVDTTYFAPQDPAQVAALRHEHGLDGLRAIVFGGVVRPHKGVETILQALERLGRQDVRLVVVGPRNEHVEALLRTASGSRYLIALGAQPKSAMPLFLDLATLSVLPLEDSALARSQMPCKVFEAMALAKPIIGTAVADLPLVLEGCGWVVPPGDIAALAAAIGHYLDHPAEAVADGLRAREKCIREYGADRARALLLGYMGAL